MRHTVFRDRVPATNATDIPDPGVSVAPFPRFRPIRGWYRGRRGAGRPGSQAREPRRRSIPPTGRCATRLPVSGFFRKPCRFPAGMHLVAEPRLVWPRRTESVPDGSHLLTVGRVAGIGSAVVRLPLRQRIVAGDFGLLENRARSLSCTSFCSTSAFPDTATLDGSSEPADQPCQTAGQGDFLHRIDVPSPVGTGGRSKKFRAIRNCHHFFTSAREARS